MLNVPINMVRPFGDWYFTGPWPANHGDDDIAKGVVGDAEREYSHMTYLVHPDAETFDLFLAARAIAVSNMAVLEYFMLTSELQGPKADCTFHIMRLGRKPDGVTKARKILDVDSLLCM
jgi:hypothetical protein